MGRGREAITSSLIFQHTKNSFISVSIVQKSCDLIILELSSAPVPYIPKGVIGYDEHKSFFLRAIQLKLLTQSLHKV